MCIYMYMNPCCCLLILNFYFFPTFYFALWCNFNHCRSCVIGENGFNALRGIVGLMFVSILGGRLLY